LQTGIPVGAGVGVVVHVDALARGWGATVVCTSVAVATLGQAGADANPGRAEVGVRAQVVVGTQVAVVRCVNAEARAWGAAIVGARLAVIATRQRTGDARPGVAAIHRAQVGIQVARGTRRHEPTGRGVAAWPEDTPAALALLRPFDGPIPTNHRLRGGRQRRGLQTLYLCLGRRGSTLITAAGNQHQRQHKG